MGVPPQPDTHANQTAVNRLQGPRRFAIITNTIRESLTTCTSYSIEAWGYSSDFSC